MKVFAVHEEFCDHFCQENNKETFLICSYLFETLESADKFLKIVRKVQREQGRTYRLEVEVIRNFEDNLDFWEKTR